MEIQDGFRVTLYVRSAQPKRLKQVEKDDHVFQFTGLNLVILFMANVQSFGWQDNIFSFFLIFDNSRF